MRSKENHVCPVERAGGLDNSLRKLFQNPKRIFRDYVKSGMTVVDLGCGPGFFSIEMADMVGESGMVIAADLQQGMLDRLGDKIRGTRIEKRIRLHRTGKRDIGISSKVDFVLAFYVLHEFPDKERAIKEIMSMLKPGGIFYLVEPKHFHVSNEEFEESVETAVRIGLREAERPRIFLSRAVVLKR